MEIKEFATPLEVAGRLNVPISTIQRELRLGRICAVKVGGKYRIPTKWLDRWLAGAEDNWRPPRKEPEAPAPVAMNENE